MMIHKTLRPFKCDLCERQFSLESSLQRHKMIHIKGRPINAVQKSVNVVQCNRTSQQTVVRRNLTIQNTLRPFKCDLCEKQFSLESSLQRHKNIHTDQKPVIDVQCRESPQQTNLRHNVIIQDALTPFTCDLCGKQFSLESSLQRHKNIHTDQKPVIGVQCRESPQQTNLRRNVIVQDALTPFTYDLCGKQFSLESRLQQHKIIHTEARPIIGIRCSEGSQQTSLSRHMKVQDALRPFKCDLCQKQFSLESSLQRHKTIHTKAKPAIGVQCNEDSQQTNLRRNVIVQDALPPFTCDLCGKQFSLESSLQRHKIIHTDQKPAIGVHRSEDSQQTSLSPQMKVQDTLGPFKCDLCQKQFSLESSLQRHKIIHTDQKPVIGVHRSEDSQQTGLSRNVIVQNVLTPFTCDLCGKQFSLESRLQQHKLIHSEAKPVIGVQCNEDSQQTNLRRNVIVQDALTPFTCDLCGKQFSLELRLQQHKLIHSKAKPVIGVQCNEDSQQTNLRRNVIVQDALTPFACDLCGKQFSLESSLQSHKIIHTEAKPVIDVQCSEGSQLTSLSRHNKVQDTLRPFKCDVCRKQFSLESRLQQHKIIHTDQRPVIGVHRSETSPKTSLSRDTIVQNALKPFKCEVCEKQFSLESSLQRHTLVHTDGKSFKCKTCRKQFSKQTSLRNHMMIHDRIQPYKCDQCRMKFRSRPLLRRHEITHTEEKLFRCDKCNEQFIQKGHLTTHILAVHDKRKPFTCDLCGNKFSRKQSLQQHLRIHSGDKPYRCDKCGKQFSQQASLSGHMETHDGIKRFKCDFCGKRFCSRPNLHQHLRIHTGDKSFKCEKCGKQFSRKHFLDRHIMAVHDKIKRFKCGVCDNKFFSKQTLNQHLRIHTGDKPFSCDKCGKQFSLKYSLYQHISRVHNGIKNIKCKKCSQKFSQKAYLVRHIRVVHDKIKPFECGICDNKFSFKANLQQHLRVHTGDKRFRCDK